MAYLDSLQVDFTVFSKPGILSHMGTNARELGDFSYAVAAELRAAIAHAGYSRRAFATRANLPITTLHKTLRGERVADVEDLAQICDYLEGVTPAAILHRAEDALAKKGKLTLGSRVVADSRYSNRGEPVAPPAPPIPLDAHRNVHDWDDIKGSIQGLPSAALEDETDPSMMLDNSETMHVDDDGFSTDNNEEGA